MIQWAFSDDSKTGSIKLQEFNDRYVVAVETKQTSEGEAKLDDIKDMIRAEVLKDKKAEYIISKLKGKHSRKWQRPLDKVR